MTATPEIAARGSDAHQMVGDLLTIMDALVATVEQETELVRSGQLRQAVELEKTKSELTSRYLADNARLKANASTTIAQGLPKAMEMLRQRHESFRALLQINLAVLATAHAVSEGIIRGAAGELARRSAPQTYGASGREIGGSPRSAPPVAVSRTL
jgi:hypothetical protein